MPTLAQEHAPAIVLLRNIAAVFRFRRATPPEHGSASRVSVAGQNSKAKKRPLCGHRGTIPAYRWRAWVDRPYLKSWIDFSAQTKSRAMRGFVLIAGAGSNLRLRVMSLGREIGWTT
jgi:hypothetical protein